MMTRTSVTRKKHQREMNTERIRRGCLETYIDESIIPSARNAMKDMLVKLRIVPGINSGLGSLSLCTKKCPRMLYCILFQSLFNSGLEEEYRENGLMTIVTADRSDDLKILSSVPCFHVFLHGPHRKDSIRMSNPCHVRLGRYEGLIFPGRSPTRRCLCRKLRIQDLLRPFPMNTALESPVRSDPVML